MKIDHPTVEPPTKAEQERTRRKTALELLRCLDEDWEYQKEHERRGKIRDVMCVLEVLEEND